MASSTEENYLKAIFTIYEKEGVSVSTNAIAAAMHTTPASVSDMLKRLAEKDLIVYEKYKGVMLSAEGVRISTQLIRKHRLWEVFLTEKLEFTWDEVHEIAEELEHIESIDLIDRLDAFLDHPRFDPHGDPIPDAEGRWKHRPQVLLSTLQPGESGVVTGVADHSPVFLQYLQQTGLILGAKVALVERISYDQSVLVRVDEKQETTLSEKVSKHLFVNKNHG